jgi:hypothetical protein
MTLQFSLTVSDNLQNFGFFPLKSVSRAKNSIWTSGVNDFYPQCFVVDPRATLGLQIAPRVKIIHFTPSGHNILFYNRQKNVTFMHRYQVAKYVIFDNEKIFVKKFPWVLK